jgi:ribosomal protein L40E
MKACPSCSEPVADDATSCGCGYRFNEGVSGLENVALAEAEAAIEKKTCLMCLQRIPRTAMRCQHCGSQVGVFDGSVYGQSFVLFFTNLWILWGTFLPWTGGAGPGVPRGVETMSGFVIAFIAFGALCAAAASIWTNRLLFWPTLLNFFMSAFFVTFRILAVVRDSAKMDELSRHTSEFLSIEWPQHLGGIVNVFGPGHVVVGLGAIFVLLFLVKSVSTGAREAKAKKQAQQAARSARRGR